MTYKNPQRKSMTFIDIEIILIFAKVFPQTEITIFFETRYG
ncbi:MAG TPA: hypothetical protein VJL57_00410 [Candidatus Paceibacterota bacterium]